jgi:hypothetical protein
MLTYNGDDNSFLNPKKHASIPIETSEFFVKNTQVDSRHCDESADVKIVVGFGL